MPQTSVTTLPAAGFPGLVGDSVKPNVNSYSNAEASAEIPFGTVVKQGTGDKEALQLTTNADKLVGVVLHSHAYAKPSEVGTVGLKPQTLMNVAETGHAWVFTDEAVTPASPVRVRNTAAGGGRGTFRTSAVATATIRLPFCRYLTSAGINQPVLLAFDFTQRDSAVGDP